MVDHSHLRMVGGQPVGDRARAVLRPVVDGDDLEFVGQPGQLGERLVNERLDVLSLVVGRKEEGQAGDAVGHGPIMYHNNVGALAGHEMRRSGAHQPCTTPQYTPQALIRMESTTRPTVHQRRPYRLRASATRITANGAKSL